MKFTCLLTLLLIYFGLTSRASVPVITIEGTKDTNVSVFTTYTPPEATAYDDEDGDISHKIKVYSIVDIQFLDTYFVEYKVEDSEGNVVYDTVWVQVVDTWPPIVLPIIVDTFKVLLNSSFSYLDYFIFADNYDPGQLLKDNHQLVYSDLDLTKSGIYTVTLRTKDGSGNWSMNGTLYVEVSRSLGVVEVKDSFLVYPNPTNGLINIKFLEPSYEPFRYTIIHSTGKVIRSSDFLFSTNETLDLSKLPSGLYYIHFDYNNQLYSTRLIIN